MGQDNDIVGQINHTLMCKTNINTIFLQTHLTKPGVMTAPKKVNRVMKMSNSSVSIVALKAAESAMGILQPLFP